MSWSKTDIISDIKKRSKQGNALFKKIDCNLPYWELRKSYKQARHTSWYIASGTFGGDYIPPNKKLD